MLRLKRNREGRREQFVRFLNVRVEDFKLFEKEEEKEFINCAFIRRFKLGCERFMYFTANFCLYFYIYIYALYYPFLIRMLLYNIRFS